METDPERQAIANVYAEALLAVAAEKGQEERVTEEFAELVAYMDRHPAFTGFMTAESVDDDPRRLSLERLFRGRMNDLLVNLLQVLNNRGRCELIRDIQHCVDLGVKQRHNQQEVMVETALPLTAQQKEDIARDVSKQIGKQAILIEKVKPELIGGVVIRIGDLQIDGSVAARMRNIRKRLCDCVRERVGASRGY